MEKRKQRQRKSNRGENGYEGSRGKGKKGNEEKNGYEKSKGKGTGNNKEEKGYSDGGPTPYSKKEQSAGKGKRKEEQRAMATLEKRCHHKGYRRCGHPVTWQKTGEFQSRTYKRLTTTSGNKRPPPISMGNNGPPAATTGGQTTKHKFKLFNSNSS